MIKPVIIFVLGVGVLVLVDFFATGSVFTTRLLQGIQSVF